MLAQRSLSLFTGLYLSLSLSPSPFSEAFLTQPFQGGNIEPFLSDSTFCGKGTEVEWGVIVVVLSLIWQRR